jgi:hypothetical protein
MTLHSLVLILISKTYGQKLISLLANVFHLSLEFSWLTKLYELVLARTLWNTP